MKKTIKRNVPNKIYEVILLVTGIFAILNIIGLWITWKNLDNPFGYIAGAFALVALIASGALAFFNEKVVVRKQWMLWAGFAIVHLVFFILSIALVKNTTDSVVPALFTVIIVLIIAAIAYILLKDRLIKNRKPYTFTPTTAAPGTESDVKDGEIVTPTIQIKVDEQEDKTPVPTFEETFTPNKTPEVKHENKPEEDDKPTDGGTGVITL